MVKLLIITAVAFVLASVSGMLLIPFLHKLKFGQEIREEGPSWHQKKAGTPTMGGFIFIIAAFLASAVGIFVLDISDKATEINGLLMMAATAAGFGVIGFLDDYIKVILKRNLGLRAGQKLALQVLVALVFSVWSVCEGVVDTQIAIPFTGRLVDLTFFGYAPFIILVMLAAVNSVNLTDGLDGLAASVTLFVALFYCIASSRENAAPVMIFSASLIGGLIGFLIYNRYPARVFMGDTGSLFLGGAVAAMAIYMRNPITLLIVGFVYVAEALSVIIQVTYFKKTGKRIFKMSPIHHHFEMSGWSEKKIVAVFSAATALLCLICFAA